MRCHWFFAFIFQLIPVNFCHAQQADSLVSSKDTTHLRRLVEEVLRQRQDSLEAVRIKTNVQKNGKSLDAFLQEMRQREEAQKRQVFIRVGLGALFLATIITVLLRRRRKT